MSNNKDKGASDSAPVGFDSKFIMEALMAEMRRMMSREMDQVHESMQAQVAQQVQEQLNQRGSERTNRVENARPEPTIPRVARRMQPKAYREEYEGYYGGGFEEEEEGENSTGSYGRRGQERGGRNWEDNNLGSIKMKIPSFHGRSDPEAYLDWEKKVEFVFDCHNYSEQKKVKLAVTEFCDYAIVWWDQLVWSRKRNRERPIQTWEEMKVVMRKRFVPNYYYRELYHKL